MPTIAPTASDFVRVVSFHWWSAANHSYLHPLNDGDVFCRKSYQLGIEARTTKPTPVTLFMNGTISNTQSESIAPYFSFGNSIDSKGKVFVNGRNFNVGNYTIISYPTSGSGSIIGRLTAKFIVVNC
jgi:hypothetical protein